MLIIEDSVLQAANMSEQELKVEIAVLLYGQNRLSFGQARKLAGMDYFDFEKLLFDRNIPSHYDVEEFKEDMALIQKGLPHGKIWMRLFGISRKAGKTGCCRDGRSSLTSKTR